MQDVREDSKRWTHTGDAVVATAHALASRAGASMLARGGNAIDAAVAASFALAVCEPGGSGLGGMAVAVVHLAQQGRTFTVEGSCVAPRRATPIAVASSRRYRGYRAVAVPRHVAVMRHLLETYGTVSLSDVLGPAIELADDGYAITPMQNELMHKYRRALFKHSARNLLLDAQGVPLAVGTQLRQPVLASTLRQLASRGLDDFFEGEIARRIDADMAAHDGFVRADDLKDAAFVQEGDVLRGMLFDREVCTLGPPGGGVALVEMSGLASALGPEVVHLDTPDGVVRTAAIIRKARLDRTTLRLRTGAESLGDAAELLEPEYLQQAATRIEEDLHTGETSHLCVVDARGNAVSMTQSIERTFGSAEVSADLGFLYNGFLRAFKVQNKKHPHYLRPGKVARSNATPTLVMRGGKVQAVVGATGSERSVSAVFCTLLRLARGSAFHAVHGPRLHATPEGKVLIESERFDPASLDALTRHGFALEDMGPYAFQAGGLQLVARTDDGQYCGVADPRRDGAAVGVPEPLVGPGQKD